MKSISGEVSITEELIRNFVERYNKITQRSRYNSVLNSCLQFYYYLSSRKLPSNKPKIVYSYDLSIEKIKLREDFLLTVVGCNHEKTIEKKRRCITKFLTEFPKDFTKKDNYSPDILGFISSKTPEDKAYIRSFLHYLFQTELINIDYSVLIHIQKRGRKLPTVYNNEEIQSIIDTFSEDNVIGLRNKAIISMIATLGIRSCDIANLHYSDFKFEERKIEFTQQKTGVKISLPIRDDIIRLVREYYKLRPKTNSDFLFINQNAPYNPISTGIIRYILRNAIAKARINTDGKKRGPHSLRSSLASAMVNSDVSYEIVQHMLGHSSDSSLRSYVKFDINKLRKCALPAAEATGFFKIWLEE